MTEFIHSERNQRVLRSAMQSEAVYRNGQRVFIVAPDKRDMEWPWAVLLMLMRMKTAFNYWRNGYKWRASWILAQR